MKKYNYILIATVIAIIFAGFYFYEQKSQKDQIGFFLTNLQDISRASIDLEEINFLTVENENNGSYKINGFTADPDDNTYYTVKPVSLSEFASTTDLTPAQVQIIMTFMKDHQYIWMIGRDSQIVGGCEAANAPCHLATKFYLQPSLLQLWFSDPATWRSSGYMYIPFQLSSNDQSYLHRYFAGVKEIGTNWYAFSGEHL